ncbi:MAG TPA: outer membrane beta-barrel protein [Gemmatimonadales bacterium]|nr:outer membrane beta-barrel protein [Gemmatimonadales bacterium]
MRTIITALTAVVLLPSLAPVQAQSAQRFSAQGSVLYVSPSGDAYEGLGSGAGFEAQLRYTPSAFSVGLGYQRSSHNIDLDGFPDETAAISGVFLEPRYVIDVGSGSYAPYIAARLALLSQSVDVEGLKASASGTQLNLGGGVLLRLTPRINLDLGATYGAIDFDDVEVSYEGQTVTIPDSGGSGKNFVLRAGLTIGLK